MLKMFIVMMVLLWTIGGGHANGVRYLIVGAYPDAKTYLYGVIAIFAVGVFGMERSMILSAFGNGK